jgi:predicted dehydrogenase
MPLNSLLRVFGSKPKPLPESEKLRIAVVGAGRMGQYHAQRLAKHPRASLVAIVDPLAAKAQALARKCRTFHLVSAADLEGRVDAAVIATPTTTHFAIGQQLLSAGIACLIEKPLASTPEEAEDLIALAAEKHRVLQVGHIERFNPAVLEASKHVRSPQFIEVNRLGPYDPRVTDIGVVMDLMIHDLDIVLFLVGSEVTRVEAFGAKILSAHEDIAKVRLHFAGGCIADLSASRVSIEKHRKIRIFQPDAYISIDYAAPKIKIYKKKTEIVKGLRDIQILSPSLPKRDALSLELDHFVDCVRDGKAPMVSGRHGRDALQLAREVLENLKIHT